MKTNLEREYKLIIPTLDIIKEEIVDLIKDALADTEHIERIYGRVKSPISFTKKSLEQEQGSLKYPNPLRDILDQIGVRVVVIYRYDVEKVQERIESFFCMIEEEEKLKSESDFGYEAIHYTLQIPPPILEKYKNKIELQFFEFQICTLFQHAWAEANHDLMYKTDNLLTYNQKKKLYWAAAQAWGADRIFSEIANLDGSSKEIKQ